MERNGYKKCPAYRRDIFWWRRVDSNHRSESQQIYSLPPLATRELLRMKLNDGAGGRTRTPDLLITNQLLYQLSYTSISARPQRRLFYQRGGHLSREKYSFFEIFKGGSGDPGTGVDRPAAGRAADASGGQVPPVPGGAVRAGAGGVYPLSGGPPAGGRGGEA